MPPASDDLDETDGAAEVPELIGRDEETGLLRRAWQSTKDEGRGQVVAISGEAGIGKSVLIDGLKAEVRAEGLPRVTLRCSPYHTGSALYPVIEHFKRLADWQPEDIARGAPRQARDRARRATTSRWPRRCRCWLAAVAAAAGGSLSAAVALAAATEAADPGRDRRHHPGDRGAPAVAGDLGGSALGRSLDPGAARAADRAGRRPRRC